jgi:hypothetical protein
MAFVLAVEARKRRSVVQIWVADGRREAGAGRRARLVGSIGAVAEVIVDLSEGDLD